MRPEYRYLMQFGLWMMLWVLLPPVAFILMIVMVVRHFRMIRAHRHQQAVAASMHQNDKRWAQLEGFGVEEPDNADWWKK